MSSQTSQPSNHPCICNSKLLAALEPGELVAELRAECLPLDRLLFHRLIWERPAQGTATNYSLRFDSCSWSAHALQDLKATDSTAHSGSIYSSYTNTKMGQTDTWSMWADKLCCGRQTRAKLRILMISGSHAPNPLQGDVLNQLPPLMCMIWHQKQAKRPGIAATIQTSSFCVTCVFLMLHGLRCLKGW